LGALSFAVPIAAAHVHVPVDVPVDVSINVPIDVPVDVDVPVDANIPIDIDGPVDVDGSAAALFLRLRIRRHGSRESESKRGKDGKNERNFFQHVVASLYVLGAIDVRNLQAAIGSGLEQANDVVLSDE